MHGFHQAYFELSEDRSQPGADAVLPAARHSDDRRTRAHYTVCDRWFTRAPRRHVAEPADVAEWLHAASTNVGREAAVRLLPDQTTIFDWLTYEGPRLRDLCRCASPIANVGPPASMLLMKNQWGNVLKHAHTLDTLAGDWKSSAKAPDVIYCEPFFNDFAIAVGVHGNCNHPPLPMAYGEAFLSRVYTALDVESARSGRGRCSSFATTSTAGSSITWRHRRCSAPRRTAITGRTRQPFETLGVRIPASWCRRSSRKRARVTSCLDHTSILQLMVDKFGKPRRPRVLR